MDWAEFLDAYKAHGGVDVTRETLRFFTVWRDVWRMTLAANCYAGYRAGEHQNYLFASVGHNEYYVSEDALCAAMTA
jgi:hypothetical protein